MVTRRKATAESVPVTRDSFVRAETDMYLPKQVEVGGCGRFGQGSVEFGRREYRKLHFTRLLSAILVLLCATVETTHSQSNQPAAVIFENVRIFNGTSDRLSAPSNVLVVGNVIKTISTAPIVDPPATSVTRIQGVGRTLMPGFTTVRDMGGPAFGLKRAVDEGIIAGPRIFPSGAIITVTSGHGDFRQPFEVPRILGAPQSRGEQIGAAMIADSPDEVRVRVREQLMLSASQIKLTAGGGVASPHSPLDVSTFTEAELRAAVEAAENWGTYVTVHAYTPASIQRAIAAGVKCIEHGHLMDEPTAKLIAEKGIWLSTQAFPDEMADVFPPGSLERAKALEVFAGT